MNGREEYLMRLEEENAAILLRDQFAMAALTGILANSKTFDEHPAVKLSYEYADLMLQARKLK